MPKDIQKSKNMQNAFNQFDNMSSESSSQSSSGSSGNGTRKAKSKVSSSGVNMFRPTDTKIEKKRFHADDKEKVDFSIGVKAPNIKAKINENKKAFILKLIIAIMAVLLFIFVIITFVPSVHIAVSTAVLGPNNEIMRIEKNNLVDNIKRVNSTAQLFGKYSTDNALKGNFNLTISDNGANTYLREELAGSYDGTFEFQSIPGTDLIRTDYNKDGIHIGNNEIAMLFSNDKIEVKPSFSNMGITADFETVVSESDKLGLQVNRENLKNFLEIYDGPSVTSLLQLYSNNENITKIIDPYAQAYKGLEKKTKFTVSDNALDKVDAVKMATVNVTWENFKAFSDDIIQKAKKDTNLPKYFTTIGYTQQHYLDVLNNISSYIEKAYNSVQPDSIVSMKVYMDKSENIIARVITMPISGSSNLIIQIRDTDTCKEFTLSENTQTKGFIVNYMKNENGYYTGEADIYNGSSIYNATFNNFIFGDMFDGNLTFTNGVSLATMDFSSDSEQALHFELTRNGTSMIDLNTTWQTFAVAKMEVAPSNTELYKLLTTVDADKYLNASSLDFAGLIDYIQQKKDITTADENLKTNISIILSGFGSKNYNYELESLEAVVVDYEQMMRDSVSKANQNAYNLAYGATNFINECIEAGEPIVPGIYCGYVSEKTANVNYKAVFNRDNLIKCLSLNADAGYFCIVVQDNNVTFTFWSEKCDFQEMVDNRTLPSYWASFDNLDDVKGSYPTASGEG